MRSVFKSFIIAVSMYSKIPMPKTEWSEKNIRFAMCFFPVIGLVIGACIYGWWMLCQALGIGVGLRSAGVITIPIIITGGIHIDGYMDTMDALHSYQAKEKKLQILKDSHIGAFSVIMLLLYYSIYEGCLLELKDSKQVLILGCGFILSRAFSGISVISFKLAKKQGMLYSFASVSHKKIVKAALSCVILLTMVIMLRTDFFMGIAVCMANAVLFFYYRIKSYREFGGITGDLAGWYLVLSELCTLIMITAVQCFG